MDYKIGDAVYCHNVASLKGILIDIKYDMNLVVVDHFNEFSQTNYPTTWHISNVKPIADKREIHRLKCLHSGNVDL